MRRLLDWILVMTLVVAPAPALADQRSDCIAKCASVASPCGQSARKSADTCQVEARKACDTVPMAEKFKCLTSGQRPCGEARNAAGTACLAAFKTCHAACGPAPARQYEFWCETEIGGGARADYRYTFCAGTAGKPGEDQARDCARKVSAALPGASGQTCEQVN